MKNPTRELNRLFQRLKLEDFEQNMKFNSEYDTLIIVEVLFQSTTLRYDIKNTWNDICFALYLEFF